MKSLNKRLISLIIILTMLGTSFIFAAGLEAYDLTLSLSHTSLKSNQRLTISGEVTKNGEGFGGTPVTVRIMNDKDALIFAEQVTTDSKGAFQVIYVPSQDLTLGSYRVMVNGGGISKTSNFTLLAPDPGPEPGGGSGGGGGGSNSRGGGKDTSPKPKDAPKNSMSTEGGTLEAIPGRIWIQVPQGALSETGVFTVEPLTTEMQQRARLAGMSQGYQLISDVYTFALTPNLPLRKPITLSFNISQEALGGRDQRLLGVYKYIANANQWIYVGGKMNASGQFTVEVSDLGTYGVLYYEKVFQDMINHWAKDEVKVTTARHITQGMTPDSYQPDGNVTRAQFAALLVRALKLPKAPYGGMFKDVGPDKWYALEVEAAARAGIVEGHDGLFNPEASITREQMATMLVRALRYIGGYTTPPITMDGNGNTSERFTDQGEIASWAVGHVEEAIHRGLMQGMGDGSFAPRQTATRAQAAVVIYRLLAKLNLI